MPIVAVSQPAQKKHIKNMTYDAAMDKARRSRHNSGNIETAVKRRASEEEFLKQSDVTKKPKTSKDTNQ